MASVWLPCRLRPLPTRKGKKKKKREKIKHPSLPPSPPSSCSPPAPRLWALSLSCAVLMCKWAYWKPAGPWRDAFHENVAVREQQSSGCLTLPATRLYSDAAVLHRSAACYDGTQMHVQSQSHGEREREKTNPCHCSQPTFAHLPRRKTLSRDQGTHTEFGEKKEKKKKRLYVDFCFQMRKRWQEAATAEEMEQLNFFFFFAAFITSGKIKAHRQRDRGLFKVLELEQHSVGNTKRFQVQSKSLFI